MDELEGCERNDARKSAVCGLGRHAEASDASQLGAYLHGLTAHQVLIRPATGRERPVVDTDLAPDDDDDPEEA